MAIPKIIHQTWKTEQIPARFVGFQQKLKQLHPDWKYVFWSDEKIEEYVKSEFSEFYPVYNSFSKNIMRFDVIRYLIMYKIGGLYLDIDYEMIKPFDLNQYQLVLPKSRSVESGDQINCLGNCVFASQPGHPFWRDIINDLTEHPPHVHHYLEVLDTTGPGYITKIFAAGNYDGVYMPERILFHPATPKNKLQYEKILNNGISYGIHHCYGSWEEIYTLDHMVRKLKKFFSFK